MNETDAQRLAKRLRHASKFWGSREEYARTTIDSLFRQAADTIEALASRAPAETCELCRGTGVVLLEGQDHTAPDGELVSSSYEDDCPRCNPTPAVPPAQAKEEWKLMPKKATPDMLINGATAWTTTDGAATYADNADACYNAMYASAPRREQSPLAAGEVDKSMAIRLIKQYTKGFSDGEFSRQQEVEKLRRLLKPFANLLIAWENDGDTPPIQKDAKSVEMNVPLEALRDVCAALES